MKKIITLLLLISASLIADTKTTQTNNFDNIKNYSIAVEHDGNTVYGDIDLENTNIRLGIYTAQYKQDKPKDEFTSYGISALFTKMTSKKTSIYYGLRLGTQKNENESGSFFAPTFGFEYYLAKKISLGSNINYYTRGLNNRRGIDTSITLRYYFK